MRFIGKQLGLGRKPARESSPAAPSLTDLCAQYNIRIRRQQRVSLMMRPVPGGFEVYIPRWMKPAHPQVSAFVWEGVQKFGGQAPPLPPEQTSRDQIVKMVAQWAQRMGVQPKRVTFREMRRKWGSCSSREN
ncbi:MAG: M48 family metallopeptidase, partial [Anaerolineae bacterium]|nr:M48 family metallopeptidase [Anaerolineae bacterium]